MIITRAPFRISFAGGGSDLSAFTNYYDGAVVSATIDLGVTVILKERFEGGLRVAYSRVEDVKDNSLLENDLVRHALEKFGLHTDLEIVSVGDVPHSLGLGSSSSFLVALIQALRAHNGLSWSWLSLAKDACDVEIVRAGRCAGLQDQYAAAFGGLTFYKFTRYGQVIPDPIDLPDPLLRSLESRLLLLWTGRYKDTHEVLKGQIKAIQEGEVGHRASILAMANLAHKLRDGLKDGDIDAVGEVMQAAWSLKKMLPGVSDSQIDIWCRAAAEAVAPDPFGCKILGAGGGGCLLVYAPVEKHQNVIEATGLRQIPFRLVPGGCRLLHV